MVYGGVREESVRKNGMVSFFYVTVKARTPFYIRPFFGWDLGFFGVFWQQLGIIGVSPGLKH